MLRRALSLYISHNMRLEWVDATNCWPRYYIQGAQHINTNPNNNISVTHACLYIASTSLQLHQPALLHVSIHHAQGYSLAI